MANSVGKTVATSGAQKRNVVQRESDRSPGSGEFQPSDQGEAPDDEARQYAGEAAHDHEATQLDADFAVRPQDFLAVGLRHRQSQASIEIIDLKQAKHDEDEYQNGEPGHTVEPTAMPWLKPISHATLKRSASGPAIAMPCSSSQLAQSE